MLDVLPAASRTVSRIRCRSASVLRIGNGRPARAERPASFGASGLERRPEEFGGLWLLQRPGAERVHGRPPGPPVKRQVRKQTRKGRAFAAETLQPGACPTSVKTRNFQESLGGVQDNLRCGVAEWAQGPDSDGTTGPGQALVPNTRIPDKGSVRR